MMLAGLSVADRHVLELARMLRDAGVTAPGGSTSRAGTALLEGFGHTLGSETA
jgi:hypothetical protein